MLPTAEHRDIIAASNSYHLCQSFGYRIQPTPLCFRPQQTVTVDRRARFDLIGH
jgi:hypothetical protein